MEDAEERLKAVMTPDFDGRIKELMTSAKSKHAVRNVSKGVAEALARLYAAFSSYSMSDPFDFCDHCVSAEEVNDIRGTPLHDLTFDQLWTIASNIILTIGAVTDFKFFLPRLIEGSRYGASYYIETVFTRFQNAEFQTWPIRERDAVKDYVRNQFEENAMSPVEQTSGATDMDALLCCAHYAGILPELLKRWTSDTRETARQQLLEWVLCAFGLPDDPYAYLNEPRAPVQPINSYYDTAGRETLLARLKTSETQQAVSEARALSSDLPSERGRRLERILGGLEAT
jgi:hypothetical protein